MMPPPNTHKPTPMDSSNPNATMIEVECNCRYEVHGGTFCTVRRQVSLGYLKEDGENAMLCGTCYHHPRLLTPDQPRHTPCQCSCEVCASGPPTPLDHDAEEDVVEAYASQTIIALAWNLVSWFYMCVLCVHIATLILLSVSLSEFV